MELTEKDKQLIAKARKLRFRDFDKAWELSEEADTEKAKEILQDISKWMYHMDEHKNGCL